MKKTIIFSALIASLLIPTTVLLANGPHGHRYYLRHSKNHKKHKFLPRPHGLVDATYQN